MKPAPRQLKTGPIDREQQLGFTRTELCVVLVVLFVGAGTVFPFIGQGGSKQGLMECKSNLGTLGRIFAAYGNDNDDALPYSSLRIGEEKSVSWDFTLRPYFMTTLIPEKELATKIDAREREEPIGRLLKCPSDAIVRPRTAAPRSYAMSRQRHRDNPDDPIDERSGVGIVLRLNSYSEIYPHPTERDRHVAPPKITTADLPAPGQTILVTEKAHISNVCYSWNAHIQTTREHVDPGELNADVYHDGFFNYLMVDGNVKSLKPEQTVGSAGSVGRDPKTHLGMWSIASGD